MRICLLSTDKLFLSEREFKNALSSIPFGESDKAALRKIKNKRAAYESLGARVALARLCGNHNFGDIKKTENGKPYFEKSDAPYFSLSHTKGIAVAVLCNQNEGGIGIDVEIINTDRNITNIANRFFSPKELKRYNESKTPESFYSIWTEKEARVKLFGKNLSSELSSQKTNPFYFYKYKIKVSEIHAIICVASEKKQKEIVFINDEDIEIYGL